MPIFCANTRKPARTQGEISREWVQIGAQQVLLIRKPIKNMYLRVKPPEGRVEITAPVHLSNANISQFVSSRIKWITRAQERIQQTQRKTDKQSNRFENEKNPQKTTEEQAKTILEKQIPAMLEKWEPIIGRKPSAITLRHMTTRWGSCTPATGRIRLNLELAWVDPELLEYVLVHELTHLHASGHGAQFQALMSSYLPNWRKLRKQLNQHHIL